MQKHVQNKHTHTHTHTHTHSLSLSHLRQNFTQDWFSHLSQSIRFQMYHCFKSVIGRQEYLDLITVNIYRTALARFRLGMSPFNVHRLRYSLSEASRACPFCPGKAEDEAHVLFDCFVYGNIRNVYINKAQNISLQEQVLSVLKMYWWEQFGCPWKVLVSSSANV